MQIEENKVYLFKFRTDDGDIVIPMRAQDKEEAVRKMQSVLSRFQTEMALDFPIVKAAPTADDGEVPSVGLPQASIPSEVLEMRIDTLLLDMGAGNLANEAKAITVKNFTGLDYIPKNYPQIVNELELIKTGQKEVPIKKPKEKK